VTDVTGILVAVTEGGGRDTKSSEVGEGKVVKEGVEDAMHTIGGERGLTLTTDINEFLEVLSRGNDSFNEASVERAIGGREEGTKFFEQTKNGLSFL